MVCDSENRSTNPFSFFLLLVFRWYIVFGGGGRIGSPLLLLISTFPLVSLASSLVTSWGCHMYTLQGRAADIMPPVPKAIEHTCTLSSGIGRDKSRKDSHTSEHYGNGYHSFINYNFCVKNTYSVTLFAFNSAD